MVVASYLPFLHPYYNSHLLLSPMIVESFSKFELEYELSQSVIGNQKTFKRYRTERYGVSDEY